MLLRVPLTDNGERLGGEVAAVVEVGFDEDVVACAEAVDVVPRPGGIEGEFVGGDADDGACVMLVKGGTHTPSLFGGIEEEGVNDRISRAARAFRTAGGRT